MQMILDGEPGSVVKNQNTDQGKYINDVLILVKSWWGPICSVETLGYYFEIENNSTLITKERLETLFGFMLSYTLIVTIGSESTKN